MQIILFCKRFDFFLNIRRKKSLKRSKVTKTKNILIKKINLIVANSKESNITALRKINHSVNDSLR